MPSTVRRRHDREIARLAVPALGALIAEPLYVLADTAVVGRLGTEELAGLAVASAALLTGFSIFIFLAYGTTAAVSRLLGAGRPDEAAHQAVQGLWLAAGIGIVVTGGVLVGADPLISLLGGSGGVADQAGIYLRISALGIPAQLLTFAGTGYLRGLQDTRTPLVVAIGAAFANLVIELVLIVGLDFGIGASALSTVVAQVATAFVFVGLVGRDARERSVSLRPDRAAIVRLATVGGDLLVRTIALRGAFTLMTALAARLGAVDVAAHEVAFAVWTLLALGLDAIAIAGQALIGRFLGAEDADEATAAGTRMLQIGLGFGLIAGAAIVSLRPWLPALFTDDPAVQDLATFLLLVVAALQPVNALAFVLDGLLIGAGDMRFLALAMVATVAVAAPIAIGVSIAGYGLGWIWGAIGVLMAVRTVVLGLRWRSRRWVVIGA